MLKFRINNQQEALDMIRAAVERLGRDDTAYNYGAAIDTATDEQIIYFDLPRVSPLQFNVSTAGAGGRVELIERVRWAIADRLAAE